MFTAAAMAGDKTMSIIPRGMYLSIISDAFRELNIDSFFMINQKDFEMPTEHLSIQLPDDCFNVRNIYIFDGDVCNVAQSKKVWWKRNYYTTGSGYFANDKGYNGNDPYYMNHSEMENRDKRFIRVEPNSTVNNVLFYNIQNGVLMLSSSCRAAGTRVHVEYNSTGCNVEEAPIIPRFFKTAIEDYAIETLMRFRMANEPANARAWQILQQTYAVRLDKDGLDGSWHKAVMRVRNMDTLQRASLAEYLGRAAWATGR